MSQLTLPSKLSLSSNFSPKPLLKFHSRLTFPPFPVSTLLPFKILCSSSPDSNQSIFPPKTFSVISLLRAISDWADCIKERGMQRDRSLYNHEKWVEHRSSLRHVRHLLSSLSSRVILSLIPPVISFTSVAAIIASYNSAVDMHWLPGFFPVLRASSLPYQLTAPALALLLVFRTEASYSRFEEGRMAWTKVIAGTNDFARQVIAGVDISGDELIKDALLGYIMAFPTALKESKLLCLHEGIGVCEQLMGTPIPLSYTRLTSRFLVLWHLTLPIILWDDCHWIVVPATFISAASLFCIEEVGVLIEEPFPMLALEELCSLVRNNIQEAITTKESIRKQLIGKRIHHSSEHSPNGYPNS
ncbi:UPF0187 protein At3g61320, chloroplastic isoform X2 [Carica papaya]|uniref:UPF0187 protein At3g61320, chloroplastic isoform X2 n=1 Tax=Carica papaya TaxID=3649 RepID=UPI000B8CCE2F|nr:UPF0187 protein At3g61320, chloroplastic isoform X2 [Carica papaya]